MQEVCTGVAERPPHSLDQRRGALVVSDRRFWGATSLTTVWCLPVQVQKTSKEYGKFEPGNKMSYRQFAAYLQDHNDNTGRRVFDTILPAYVALRA